MEKKAKKNERLRKIFEESKEEKWNIRSLSSILWSVSREGGKETREAWRYWKSLWRIELSWVGNEADVQLMMNWQSNCGRNWIFCTPAMTHGSVARTMLDGWSDRCTWNRHYTSLLFYIIIYRFCHTSLKHFDSDFHGDRCMLWILYFVCYPLLSVSNLIWCLANDEDYSTLDSWH